MYGEGTCSFRISSSAINLDGCGCKNGCVEDDSKCLAINTCGFRHAANPTITFIREPPSTICIYLRMCMYLFHCYNDVSRRKKVVFKSQIYY